jgi:hypothetical protein
MPSGCLKAGVKPRYEFFEGDADEIARFTAQQTRDLLVKLLKLHPEKSDRQLPLPRSPFSNHHERCPQRRIGV